MQNTPGHLLIRLKTHLEIGGELPVEIVDWLRYGINDFEKSGGKKPLCISLGLRGVGQQSIMTKLASVKRNKWLYKAWKLVSVDKTLDDWNRSKRLLEYINKFEVMTWRRVKANDEPPERLDPIQQALFIAFKTGAEIPSSIKQIHRISMDMK